MLLAFIFTISHSLIISYTFSHATSLSHDLKDLLIWMLKSLK